MAIIGLKLRSWDDKIPRGYTVQREGEQREKRRDRDNRIEGKTAGDEHIKAKTSKSATTGRPKKRVEFELKNRRNDLISRTGENFRETVTKRIGSRKWKKNSKRRKHRYDKVYIG